MEKDRHLNDDFLIALNNVSVNTEGHTLLSGVTWQLKRGENWALLGGNGAGKSSLLRLIRSELWPDAGGAGKRIYNLDGNPGESAVGIKKRIPLFSSELQDRYHRHRWDMSGREVVYTGFFDSAWLHQAPADEQKESAERIIRELRLLPLCSKNFLEMSRGEARKILIARALVAGPDILALDEPCDGLDPSSAGKLLQMIEAVASSGIPVLYATHRISELIPSITHVLIIGNGRIISQGAKDSVLAGGPDGAAIPDVQVPGNSKAPLSPYRGNNTGRSPLIRITNADVFIKDKKVLHDISWVMRKGEHWAVIGRNGAGKSTLLKLVAGDVYPALGGEISRFRATGSGSIRNLRKRIGVVSPELQRDYSYNIKGLDAVISGFFSSVGLYDRITGRHRKKALHWIDFFHLQSLSRKRMQEMSYGEQRKILIARAMVNSPDILILDEPCSGLDGDSRSLFLSLMDEAAQSGVSLIMSSHQLDEMPSSITHVMIIDEGRIIVRGKREEILKENKFPPLPAGS